MSWRALGMVRYAKLSKKKTKQKDALIVSCFQMLDESMLKVHHSSNVHTRIKRLKDLQVTKIYS